jgi:hypothetical protein
LLNARFHTTVVGNWHSHGARQQCRHRVPAHVARGSVLDGGRIRPLFGQEVDENPTGKLMPGVDCSAARWE